MTIFRRIRRVFSPRTHFQPIFSQQAAYIKQASSALLQMMKTQDISERKRLEREVKICETQGDAMLTEFYEQLNDKYYSILHRSDLQAVAGNIDDILDNINGSAKSIIRYMPQTIDTQLIDLAEYICAEAEALTQIVTGMDEMKKRFSEMTVQCDRITELEHAADEVYEEYVTYIFQHETDAIELMKHKNIAEMLETTSDTAKTFSDHIRKLLLRYVIEK